MPSAAKDSSSNATIMATPAKASQAKNKQRYLSSNMMQSSGIMDTMTL